MMYFTRRYERKLKCFMLLIFFTLVSRIYQSKKNTNTQLPATHEPEQHKEKVKDKSILNDTTNLKHIVKHSLGNTTTNFLLTPIEDKVVPLFMKGRMGDYGRHMFSQKYKLHYCAIYKNMFTAGTNIFCFMDNPQKCSLLLTMFQYPNGLYDEWKASFQVSDAVQFVSKLGCYGSI